MNTEILGVVVQIALMVILAYPLGKYIAKVYKGEKTWSDFMAPVERVIYKVCGINPDEEMNWKQFLKALLVINLFWFFWGMILLVSQGVLPLNPDGNLGQSVHQAFNTCISFLVNCNLQHYSGESGLSYLTQLFVIMLFQFITAATGMAAMAGIMKALAAAIQAMSQDEINAFEKAGTFTLTFEGQEAMIERADVEIISEDIPGWLVANEGRLTVALTDAGGRPYAVVVFQEKQ